MYGYRYGYGPRFGPRFGPRYGYGRGGYPPYGYGVGPAAFAGGLVGGFTGAAVASSFFW
jgi:hypothetical protein